MMKQALMTPAEAAALIKQGMVLGVAGDEALLDQLPAGKWVGGTVPYFVADQGGLETHDKVFVTKFVDVDPASVHFKLYTLETIENIAKDGPDNGFSFMVVPAATPICLEFATSSMHWDDMFVKPVVGWVTGVALEDLGRVKPKVYDGTTLRKYDNEAVVIHAPLPPSKQAAVKIINLFKQGKGDVVTFPEVGFSTTKCMVNGGEPMLFADYIESRGLDVKLPFVADYFGAMINCAIQAIDPVTRAVSFYAPVFPGVEYRQAEPVGDYVEAFDAATSKLKEEPAFACNCVLNYLYGELKGRRTGSATGPFTFGEIGYQLLNQTLVYLDVRNTG